MINENLKYILISIALLIPNALFAATEGGHGSTGIDEHTKSLIMYQTINVVVMFAGLIYFLRSHVKNFFKAKKEQFVLSAKKAEQARAAAEEEHLQIQVRLTKLESTAEESISRAKAEAAEMKNSIIAEAQTLSKRIREEANASALLEIEKAKIKIRHELIRLSVESSRSQMETKVSGEDHLRLQGNFINNIQAVQT